MTNKAYIVVNEQQECEVLEKLEREGYLWRGTDMRPTEKHRLIDKPITIFARDDKRLSFDFRVNEAYLADYEIEIDFDGRKESKMKISKEVYDALVEWRNGNKLEVSSILSVGIYNLINMPSVVYDWWLDSNISKRESNNRLIAIIRWVNGEDVFEVEKWVVRSDSKDSEGNYWYVRLDRNEHNKSNVGYDIETATRFDTKEEAESWANSHQEVVKVEE